VVPLTLALTSVQVAPPSSEPINFCPPCSPPLSVALMVWLWVAVMKSLLLDPVSLEMLSMLTVCEGAVESMVTA